MSDDLEAERFFTFVRDRTEELKLVGMAEGRARSTAMLEHRIKSWPPGWGDELRIVIYGDFQAPEEELRFPELGILIEPGAVKNSIVRTATSVAKAHVQVSTKSIAGIVNACGRIDTLLGIMVALNWGNSGMGWWCHITHGLMGGLMMAIKHDQLEQALRSLGKLDQRVYRRVISALYWIREPKKMVMESYRSDILRAYAGYWNAFECLVDAVCIVRPLEKRKGKQEQIDSFFADHKITPTSIAECYRMVVDPGFK